MKRLRGLSAQLLLFLVLPVFILLSIVAVGSVALHQNAMRTMVGERDLAAVRTAAAALSDPAHADSQHIQAVLKELQASPQARVMLVDGEDRAVYDSDPGLVGQVIVHPGISEALAGQSGILYRSDVPGGEGHVVAYAPVAIVPANGQAANWALVMDEPWADVASPWLRISLVVPLVMVLAVAFALAAIWLGVKRVIQPLQKLDAQVVALGGGDFAAVSTPVGGIEEIEGLREALARMGTQIQSYQQSLLGYLDAVTEAQEEERKRLARELHDETAQDLIALKQRVQAARRRLPRDSGALDEQLTALQTMIDATMEEVRRFSRALRPIYLEEAGLLAALEALARDTTRSELHVELKVDGEPRRLTGEAELTLYRIVQEALNNVTRHAHASSAVVSVRFTEQLVEVSVQDDGTGFQPPELMSDLVKEGHLGLKGMQERARLIGAQLAIRSGSHGTTVDVQAPA